MIVPIARWAIKKALLAAAQPIDKAIQDRATERQMDRLLAEISKEKEREAFDPAYRAYKDAVREKECIAAEEAPIARETQERKEYNLYHCRKLLWNVSLGTYIICGLYCLINSSYHANHIQDIARQSGWFLHDSVENALASMWVFATVLWAANDVIIFWDKKNVAPSGMGCGVIVLVPIMIWLGYVILVACSRGFVM